MLFRSDAIQLGPGTDLAAAARCLPGAHLQPLVDPLLMRQSAPECVVGSVRRLLDACSPAPATTLCVWSMDRDTPIGNVAALYETVEHSTRDAQTRPAAR